MLSKKTLLEANYTRFLLLQEVLDKLSKEFAFIRLVLDIQGRLVTRVKMGMEVNGQELQIYITMVAMWRSVKCRLTMDIY